MKTLKCEIVANKKYGDKIFKIEVFSPYICKNAIPGQFVNVRCSSPGSYDPLLRRPFSIYEVDKRFNVFSLLYLIKGKGTFFLSSLQKGEEIDVVGPLGNGIKDYKDHKDFLLIGGGIGVAPLCFLAKELIENGKNVFFIAGFRDNTFYFWEKDLIKILRNYTLFTEDGSIGEKGVPSDYIRLRLSDFKNHFIYTCGPVDMLKNIQAILSGRKIRAYAIMEEKMACGIGACMGCAIKISDNMGGFYYLKACSDGPVFDLLEVVFD